MPSIARRAFMQGAALGALVFTVGGANVLLTPHQARAQNIPFRELQPDEVETVEAIGETLVPGARAAGIAHFVDQQISIEPSEALLTARIMNVRPPFDRFYSGALEAVNRQSHAMHGQRFADLSAAQQRDFISNMRQNTLEGWQGPPPPLLYAVFRNDSVDVVYGTIEGFRRLGIPYMPHILPDKRW